MSHDDKGLREDKGLRTAVEKLEATEAAIEHDIGEAFGTTSPMQNTLIEDLTRLQRSLQGPEIYIDRHSYGRPFPPQPPRYTKETGVVISSAAGT